MKPRFSNKALLTAVAMNILFFATLVQASNEHDGKHEMVVKLSAKSIAKNGIETAVAGPGSIDKRLAVYGKVELDSSRVSHLRARFPGMLAVVNVHVGDKVEKGAVLVEIESNESLKRYSIKAPFDGVVTARHGAVGEFASDQELLTLTNLKLLWAELKIFPGQMANVVVGQSVQLLLDSQAGDPSIRSTIDHLLPAAGGKPYVIARVRIDNQSGRWTPGLLVKGLVITQQVDARIRVENDGIQLRERQPVVFVKSADGYRLRRIQPGLRGAEFTEILSGLEPGEEYVTGNSYLLKADLEKSGASHDH